MSEEEVNKKRLSHAENWWKFLDPSKKVEVFEKEVKTDKERKEFSDENLKELER